MDPHKALGSYGFGKSFFQDHWAIIKDQLCFAVKDFFNSGQLLKELNHTSIDLISKVDNLETILQFGPIRICDILNKIFAKILVNRIRLV